MSSTYDKVNIPTLSGDELAQVFEERYLKTATEVNQTIEKSGLKITLVRVGEFEHLKYNSWEDRVRDFRADFVITNTGLEPIHTPLVCHS